MVSEQKRITIITDPHIKVDYDFFVYKNGLDVIAAKDGEGNNILSAFVRDSTQT